MSEGQSMQAEGVWTLQPLVELSAQDFRDWCRVLEERTGLVINEQRRSFLQANLGMRMRELGMTDYASYLRQVLDGPRGAVEWSLLMDRLTIQETRFFRHPPSFALLQRYLQERVQAGLQRPLALWSLGCSTGEEAYSLAVVAAEVLRDTQTTDAFGVTATDISLIEIVEAMEGPLAITECSHDQSQCGIAQQCGVRSNWRLINDVLAEALRGVTLAQMLHPLPHSDRRRISVAVVP